MEGEIFVGVDWNIMDLWEGYRVQGRLKKEAVRIVLFVMWFIPCCR